MQKQYFSNTAFIDLLFNIVVGIAFLFIIAFLLINPISKKHDIESKADYLIQIYWNPESVHDIDVWVQDPAGNILSFKHKDIGFMHLDRDDLGYRNDKITYPDGREVVIKNNEETVALRGTLEGWYTVNIHAYRKLPLLNKETKARYNDELPVKVVLLKVNPYKELLRKELIFIEEGEEKTAFRFELDEEGKMNSYDEEQIQIVTVKFGNTGTFQGSGGF